jgi:hypothetical protein
MAIHTSHITDLRAAAAAVAQANKENLSVVYVQQMEWARHYNQLIWIIGAILLPASLAGLVGKYRSENTQEFDWITYVAIGLSSVVAIIAWGLLAEWHRRLWGRAFALTGLIEREWKLRPTEAALVDIDRHLLDFLAPVDPSGSDPATRVRKYIPWIVAIIWVGRGIAEALLK